MYHLQTMKHSGYGEFDRLRRRLNHFLDNWAQAHVGESAPWRQSKLLPLLNIFETDTEFVVTTEAPGIDVKDLEISVDGETLCLQGERRPHEAIKSKASWRLRERATGRFHRSVLLPGRVDPIGVRANYSNGELVVRIPKSRDQAPKKIEITTDQAPHEV